MTEINQLTAQLEALLSARSEPISVTELSDLTDSDAESVQTAITHLENNLESRGVSLIKHDNQVQLITDPQFGDIIADHREEQIDTNLTKAQSEALSVIAYMHPVAKPTIDFVRGVNSRAVLRNLSTRGLINKDKSGESVHFSLSTEALQHLGITSVEELPKYKETREKLAEFVATNQKDN